MRTNKVNNVDLFTQAANEGFEKHIKTQSKRALETINQKISWNDLIAPIGNKIGKCEILLFRSCVVKIICSLNVVNKINL